MQSSLPLGRFSLDLANLAAIQDSAETLRFKLVVVCGKRYELKNDFETAWKSCSGGEVPVVAVATNKQDTLLAYPQLLEISQGARERQTRSRTQKK